MSILQKSPRYAAGVGRALVLDGGRHLYVEVEAGADIWVRASEDATEEAPSATPAPGADDTIGSFIHLGTAGDKAIFDLTKLGARLGATRGIVQLLFWTVGAGTHRVDGPGF